MGIGHLPQSAHSCKLGLRAVAAAQRRPGVAPPAWLWGVRGWVLPSARSPVLGACGRGPLPTGCVCGVCGRRDPSATPQRALLRAGFARCGGRTRAPGGGTSCLAVGRPGLGALLRPMARPWGVRPGPATHWLWVRAVLAWGPATYRTARALASWLCALWVRHEGAWGQGACCLAMGRPGLGALSGPTARPWGVHPVPATHWLCVRGLWAWIPATYPAVRALASWLCAMWGRHEDARGGGRLLPGCGASGAGRSPAPHCLSFGRAAGARYPLAVDVAGVGMGNRHLRHNAPSLEHALPAVGAAQGRPGRWGAFCLAVGRPGLGPVPRSTARPRCVRPGPATHWLWVRGVWAWGSATYPRARSLASWLCALCGRHEGARGGMTLAWLWGVRGWVLSHAQPLVLGVCGRGPLPTGCGCGGCGQGDLPPTLQRGLLRAGFAHCGGGTSTPEGGRL